MRRAKDIMGLPVLDIEAGKQLGIAKDFLIDRDWNLQGVLLESKNWFASPRYIGWEDIVSIGTDAVTVKDEQAVRSMDDSGSEWVALLDGGFKLKGLPVITLDGENLGLVEDVYFGDKMDKKIVGYELSDGFISDIKEGRKWLPSPQSATIGEDAVMVPVGCVAQETPSFHEIG
ncbi:PRC-barrel domain-containing protein [Paenibacillus oceani]|uniref:PRC-barrel domain-containing protein n=1 Tax=Paenibacillus oceani TaxID=2772510 RepID=A0A927CEA2_9BACL|nr:PRC-barrel domain-containing protein [Paenibacillus oceani]MBD2865287.1 PRC-barrel domain-containing protein [Paenibacillus oceani]MDF2659152.1 subunit of photosystem reaction center [Paenibacillus sp.]